MGTLNCDNCGGFSSCVNACYMHLGKAMVDYIDGIDVIDTKIGDYESRTYKGTQDLVVSGHQIYKTDSPGWILTDISTVLDKSDKFKSAYEMTAFQIAKKYCEKIGKTQEETDVILEKIRMINKNRSLIVPFKPNTTCSIIYNDGDVVSKGIDSTISSIRWCTNTETHKLEATIIFDVENMPKKTQRYNITDYLKTFSLSQINLNAKTAKLDKKLISIDNNGIIKPIVIKQGNIQIAVDGSYVYQINPQGTSIIGVWGTGDKLLISNSIKIDAITKTKDNENFIRCHKKYIAPYMMYEPNVVEV